MSKNHKASAVPAIKKLFSDYANYHQTKGNVISHYFGITLITLSLLGLLGQLIIPMSFLESTGIFRLDGGILLLVISALWYLALDWKLAIPFILFVSGLYFFGRVIPNSIHWVLFILGWVIQFVGHYLFEKKSPAFFKNVLHLLIGPLWIFSKWIGYLPTQDHETNSNNLKEEKKVQSTP